MANTMEFRQGYRDAVELQESLNDLDMVAHAEPPAMSEEYRKGFRTAIRIMRKNGES